MPLVLWLGQVGSTIGDRLYSTAMLWIALQLTGSAEAMGVTAIAQSLTLTVVGLFSGVLIDRMNKFRISVAVDCARAIVVLIIPLAHFLGHLNIGLLICTGVIMGALNGIFSPSFQSVLPDLVKREEFYGLAGLMDTPARFAQLFGSGSAGALLSVIPVVGFFEIDSISFGISVLSLVFVSRLFTRADGAPRAVPHARNFASDLLAGFGVVFSSYRMLCLFIADGIGNLLFVAYTLGGLILATHELKIGLGGYGWFIAAYGVGSLVGNFVAGNITMKSARFFLSISGWLGIGIGFVVMGLFHSAVIAMVVLTFAGFCGSIAHVSRATFLADAVPRENLGKVYSLRNILVTVCGTVGIIVVGNLLDHWLASRVILVSGTVITLLDFILLSSLFGVTLFKRLRLLWH